MDNEWFELEKGRMKGFDSDDFKNSPEYKKHLNDMNFTHKHDKLIRQLTAEREYFLKDMVQQHCYWWQKMVLNENFNISEQVKMKYKFIDDAEKMKLFGSRTI
jgi:lysine/ornithine N-monooxygenase